MIGNKTFRRIVYFLGILLVLTSCNKDDFSINSDYEDITIAYCFLDLDNSLHYVKVYKSFLTEGSAYDAAKDINNYSYIDSIDVYLEEYNGATLNWSIKLDTTTSIPKKEGVFASPLQVLYYCNADLNEQRSYLLRIKHRYIEKEIIAETNLVKFKSSLLKKPSVQSAVLGFPDNTMQLQYTLSPNIKLYEAEFKYYYTEVLQDLSRRQGSPIVWNIGSTTNSSISYHGETMLQRIGLGIKEDENVKYRRTDSIELYIYTAAEDYYYYMKALEATAGLNQERLEYSNMKVKEDGQFIKDSKSAIGVFSSKGTTRIMFREFNTMTNDSLYNGRFTKHLNFQYD